MKNIAGLTKIGKTSWENVFNTWQKNEGVREEWHEVARKKGWNTWLEWRSASADKINAAKREWYEYQINEPVKTVPGFKVGPFKSWQDHFPENEKNQHVFRHLLTQTSFVENKKVQEIVKHFPLKTELIGLVTGRNNIVLLEGHHRATALTIFEQQKIEKNNINVVIALTFLASDEEGVLDNILKKGTEK